jgi:hypothetical protein
MAVGAQHDIGVADQLLYDLFRLQIPQDNFVVLATRYDPLKTKSELCFFFFSKAHLSTGDGEVGKDTVFFVLVSNVRFQCFALAKVPQFKCAKKTKKFNHE